MDLVIDHLNRPMIKLLNFPLAGLLIYKTGITSPSLPILKNFGEDQTRAFNHVTEAFQKPTLCQVQCQFWGAY